MFGGSTYTLQAREAEYELIPIALDQKLAVLVWSPIAGGLLSGKHRRNETAEGSRVVAGWGEPPVRDENALWAIVDELLAVTDFNPVRRTKFTAERTTPIRKAATRR